MEYKALRLTKKIILSFAICLAIIYILLTIIAFLPLQTIPIKRLVGKEDKFIRLNGQEIHYIQKGNGKPIILIHGFAGSTYTWRKLIPPLSKHYTVFAIDLPGFGLSAKPPQGSYDMVSQAKILLDFMEALKLNSANLIGHSMGGVVVSYAAIIAPSKVNSLVLIEPGFYARGAPPFLKYLIFPLDRIMARLIYTKSFMKKFLFNSYYNKSLVTEDVINGYLFPNLTPNSLEALVHMIKSVGQRRYEGITEKISCPTLIVWGENPLRKDMPLKLKEAKEFKSEIANSKLVIIKECGHYIQDEKPQKLLKIILEFLDLI